MAAGRSGRGRPIDQRAWPVDGPTHVWLAYCDKIHRANGLPSLQAVATAMNLRSRTRVNDLLRGLALPTDVAQTRALLQALGAVGAEVDQGARLFEAAAQAGHGHVARDADQPHWWLRSGYVEQVADIAPLQLLDRQAEVAELADWCTGGDEPYVWWQAGPRAGKSALMAWLVLHPPPRVWVVSFFVTARYAGQADSTAFTDGLLDQLTAITGQQVPPLTSAPQRDRLRRQLLVQAVVQASKAGRRLVLLVDGLDEDCGSLPGSGVPSIAACLPKRPPEGLRVIVSARPDPPMPADVDAEHPLRGCRVRRLSVSPHATRVTDLAQDELDEVLATDQDRHNGLGFHVLGLVTACGGGLDRRDLQQLTGRPAFEIDRLLRGVFGRTIAGRADPYTRERVFLFTHETLRVQAVDRLGPDILVGFAERLHTWAAGYQHRGWPVDTPGYLLRGYPRMLADAKDLDRLVRLATDPARHHRMLDATGGDAAALTEIAATLTLISAQPSPDLLAALRLAWYRDQLAERNRNIPVGLPAVWVALGQPVRGQALARSITDPYLQARALSGVAGAVAATGEHDHACALADDAQQIARSITDPYLQVEALSSVAAAMAAAGEHDRARALADDAEQIARSITNPDGQDEALSGVAAAMAASGEHDRTRALADDAEQIARSITNPDGKAQALSGVAAAMAASGEHDRARALADEAEQIARSIADQYRQAQALSELATAVAAAREHARARALADYAEQIARSITDQYRQAQALSSVAEAVAAAGDHHDAERIARSIINPYARAQALSGVAAATAAAGGHDHDHAEQIARSIKIPLEQARALSSAASALAAAGEHDRARVLADDAERMARSINDPYLQAWALSEVAAAMAAAGGHDRARALADDAERIARSITHSYERARALSGVAAAMAAAGGRDYAEQVARSITDPDWQAQVLISLTAGAEPARARSSIAAALAVGPWTIPLKAIAHIDSPALATFANDWVRPSPHARP